MLEFETSPESDELAVTINSPDGVRSSATKKSREEVAFAAMIQWVNAEMLGGRFCGWYVTVTPRLCKPWITVRAGEPGFVFNKLPANPTPFRESRFVSADMFVNTLCSAWTEKRFVRPLKSVRSLSWPSWTLRKSSRVKLSRKFRSRIKLPFKERLFRLVNPLRTL